jgi:LPS-assembly protein
LPYVSPAGDVYNLSLSLQTDLYNVDSVQTPQGTEDGFTGRVFPQMQFNWRYPFVRNGGSTTQLIEPLAGFVVGPRGHNPDKIPNEDSIDVEFDDLNLFRENRYPGVDRVEGGQRVVYGLRGGVYGAGGGSTTAFIGQSYRFNEDREFQPGSGLETELSDIVGRVSVSPNNLLDFIYRFRVNAERFEARRNEVTMSAGPSRLRLDLTYIFLDQEATVGQVGDRQEVTAALNVGLTNYWSAFANGRRNVEDDEFISLGGGLQYSDECLIFRASISRRFTRDRDLVPSNTILFQFIFKNLGEIQTGL